MILKVARLGFPSVRTVAAPIPIDQITTHDFQKLIDDMVETMHEYVGVGLAAPQVHLAIQLCVLQVENHPRHPDMPPVPLTVLINPRLTFDGDDIEEDWEGCLSVPDLRGRVPRFVRLTVAALDRDAKPTEIQAVGFHARVIQHETDHLRGEVYLDRMRDMKSLSFLAEWQRFTLRTG
jgi:peptide deformylase